jgi:hypothetical protein
MWGGAGPVLGDLSVGAKTAGLGLRLLSAHRLVWLPHRLPFASEGPRCGCGAVQGMF